MQDVHLFNTSTCGLVAMTSASHAEGRQFDPGQVYFEVLKRQHPQAARLRARPIASIAQW
jgi:hypothetical protein